MSIGQFNERLKIYERIQQPNGRGGGNIIEQEIDEVWCKIRQSKPTETTQYSTEEIKINTILDIRYHPLIKPGKKYVGFIGARRFDIVTPVDKEQERRFYELPAAEVF